MAHITVGNSCVGQGFADRRRNEVTYSLVCPRSDLMKKVKKKKKEVTTQKYGDGGGGEKRKEQEIGNTQKYGDWEGGEGGRWGGVEEKKEEKKTHRRLPFADSVSPGRRFDCLLSGCLFHRLFARTNSLIKKLFFLILHRR